MTTCREIDAKKTDAIKLRKAKLSAVFTQKQDWPYILERRCKMSVVPNHATWWWVGSGSRKTPVVSSRRPLVWPQWRTWYPTCCLGCEHTPGDAATVKQPATQLLRCCIGLLLHRPNCSQSGQKMQ